MITKNAQRHKKLFLWKKQNASLDEEEIERLDDEDEDEFLVDSKKKNKSSMMVRGILPSDLVQEYCDKLKYDEEDFYYTEEFSSTVLQIVVDWRVKN